MHNMQSLMVAGIQINSGMHIEGEEMRSNWKKNYYFQLHSVLRGEIVKIN